MSKKLSFHEWLILILIIGFMASLLVSSAISSHTAKISLDHSTFGRKIPVTVLGAVRKEGCYYVPEGSNVQFVLQKAKSSKEADLSKVDLKKKIQEPVEILIPTLKEWTIYISGAVQESGSIQVPLKTRVCDLKKILTLFDDADLQSLKSRRYLKHGEELWIPKIDERFHSDRFKLHQKSNSQ